MVHLFLLAAMLPLAIATPPPTQGNAAAHTCPAALPHMAADEGRARFRRLDELPPAAAVKLVDRRVDGCETPLVVRYGIGSRPHQGRVAH